MIRPIKTAFCLFLAILPLTVLSCITAAKPEAPRKQVFIITDPPGAEVRLNDAVLEQRTPLSLDKIQPGSYLIAINKEGYIPLEFKREVKEDTVINIKEELQPKTGNLYVITEPPGAEISVDGEYQGQAPNNLKLVIGQHNIEVKLQNYRRDKRIVDVEYNKEANLHLRLENLREQPFRLVCPDNSDCAKLCHGSVGVAIGSTPDEALVYLDNRKVGHTPVRVALGLGEYKFRLVKPGYADEDFTVKLDTPKILKQEVRLKLKDVEDMVYIKEGLFNMGNIKGDDDEFPAHKSYVNKYYIDEYEVTNAQYRRFIEATGYPAPAGFYDTRLNGDSQPVVGVTWFEAAAYAHWVGKRLPTEAEWEKAARGAAEGYLYPWGMQWKDDVCNSLELALGMTKPVGSFPDGVSPNITHDMAGNVWEWCADWYDAAYYNHAPIENPKGPRYGINKVIRGGSYMDDQKSQRTTKRLGLDPSNKLLNVGFRCARDFLAIPSAPTQGKMGIW